MATVAVQSSTSPVLSSAAGIIALLDENDNELRAIALQKLHLIVNHFWAEIADAVPLIESLAEDETFPERQLAASVASQCFFHLEEYSEALRLAMGAGKYFDVNARSQYVETLIATCIDEYIASRNDEKATTDARMEEIVERMFQRCYNDQKYAQALGIAVESKRLDKVAEIFSKAQDQLPDLLSYAFDLCRSVIPNRDFRLKVLQEMVVKYNSLANPDYSSTCQCLQILGKHEEVAAILDKLIRSTVDDTLLAYQVAFDLYDNENQRFLTAVNASLPKPSSKTPSPATEGEEKKEEEQTTDLTKEPVPEGAHADYWIRAMKLQSILSGSFGSELMLSFLHGKSNTDMRLMRHIKTAVENRNSVLHNSAVVTHAYLNCGSTVDSFLRENLDWMGRASNWAKFTATASLGVVHRNHVKESLNLLRPYLPEGGISSSSYSSGGALYALGLIHANQSTGTGAERIEYLRNALRNSGNDETVQHGACLGLGLAAMSKHDYGIYEDLKNILFTDSAVAGEAASLAIGLLLLGAGSASEQNSEIVTELLAYAHDTKHEKIIRGAGLAIALIMYGREEEADGLIEQMVRDRDPIIRYGAMYTIAMAYCGTANNSAIKRLLHVAVSDVSDDVRRAAVTCLGFLLFRTPEQVPKLVSLLAESFNPHVRYGSCLAVGIACAGTAKNEALQLLEPMMDDPVDYVRQGATMAISMVIMQESEARNSMSKKIRDKVYKVITDKHQSTMTKMGAILSQGILDAGGRNVVISMLSRTGFSKMSSVVGLAIWAQHWFWYPLMHFLELSFQPTALIGLNKDLLLPKSFEATCHAKPSMFAYPKHLEEKKEEKKELVATAVLSTTAKAKARQDKKDKASGKEETKEETSSAMEIDTEGGESKTEDATATKKKVKEPESFVISNPDRITRSQESYITIDLNQRYVPIVPGRRPVGIVMLKDTKPGEPEDVEELKAPNAAAAENEEEADPPEPFEWEPPKN